MCRGNDRCGCCCTEPLFHSVGSVLRLRPCVPAQRGGGLQCCREGLSSGIPPGGAQPLPAAAGQDVALASLVFVGAHQATGLVPALSWCRCNAAAAFVAWDLADPSRLRPGRKRAGQLKEEAGPVCCHVLVSAHGWFAGCFQDRLVLVFGSFR